MSPVQRNVALFVGLFVGVSIVVAYASYFWFKTFISDRNFASSFVHWPMLLSWIPAALFFAAAGTALAATLRTAKLAYWAFAFGALYSVIRIAVSSYWFSPDSGVFEYFWAYAGHAVPPLACLAGALYAQNHATRRLR